MTRSRFYDIISLVFLVLGGIFLIWGGYEILQEVYRLGVVLFISGLVSWRMSAVYARLAMAASGRKNH